MSFQKRLASGEFAVLAEIHTPKGVNISRLVNDARRLKGRVDAVVIPDMENGIMRMSALAGGVLLQQQGMETIVHMYCRDRNRMALQGDALAAHVLGIQNIIVADSASMDESDHCEAPSIDDLNESEFVEALVKLQQGKDISGFELDGSPDFSLGTTLAPFTDAQGLEASLAEAKARIAAGASYVVTPPIYSIADSKDILSQIKTLDVPVIATVFLLKSLAIAQYIANSEPGAAIGDETISRIRKSADREQEGVLIAAETTTALKDLCQGVVIQTLGWEHKVPAILDAAKL